MDKKRLSELKKFLKLKKLPFSKLELLDRALTHRSFANEQKGVDHNETLEFLGDSVIQLVVNEYLFRTYPMFRENKLSRIKSYVVSKKILYLIAKELGIGSVLRLGRGEAATDGFNKESNLANALEAVIGAFFLDRGHEAVKKYFLKYFLPHIKGMVNEEVDFDNKSKLQEYAQKNLHIRPLYQVVDISGPEHKKKFKVEVYLGDKLFGVGDGYRKSAAEESAARDALLKIDSQKNKLTKK